MAFPFRRISPSVIRSATLPSGPDPRNAHRTACRRFRASPGRRTNSRLCWRAPRAIGSAALDPLTNRLRGFAVSRLAADEAEILTIAVDPAWRRRGVGRDLMREHVQRAALAGAGTLFLEVDADKLLPIDTALSSPGFVKVGERAGYYRRPDGKPATALVMRRNLT